MAIIDSDGRDLPSLAAEARRRLGPPPELPAWPLVSIVVPNRDGAPLLRRLLAGLVDRTDYPELELVLVDNASRDDSLELIRAAEAPFPIAILANPHNESFSDACNGGAALAAGELLLFLNNDVDPFEPGWLRELVACLRHSRAAAAGSTLLERVAGDGGARYAVHQRGLTAAESEGLLVPSYRDRGADPLGEGLGKDVETVALLASCLLIERAAFEDVGGFTHGYWYGAEDSDLGLKLRERGERAVCSGRSLLAHTPNSTLDGVDPGRRGEWVRGNRRLFAERWGPRGRREFELDRLRGGGLWAEPAPSGQSPATPSGAAPPEHSEAELEALSFCLLAAEAGGPPGEPTGASISLDALCAAIRRRGRRCLLLRGAEVEALAGLEYDVAVHLRGPCRYVLRPAQLNVLWGVGHAEAVPELERSRYDLVLSDDSDGSPAAVERLADRLIQASDEHAEASGFRTRIEPQQVSRG